MGPVTSFSAEVEVELSREEPTLGSLLLTFYIMHRVNGGHEIREPTRGRREVNTYDIPSQERDEINRNERPHSENARLELLTSSGSWLS